MDPQIEELKELVRRNTKVTEDTNRIIHGMQRSARWGMVFRVLWWLTIFGVTSAIYFYYFAPYIQQIEQLYGNAQGWEAQISDFFNRFNQQQ